MKKYLLLLLAILVLAGCGGAESIDSPADESAVAETVVAPTAATEETETIDPAPTATAAPEQTPAPADSGTETTADGQERDVAATEPASTTSFRLDAWADNWFAAYLGEDRIVEDSVSITTERSFNAETVTFEAGYPLHLNFILKDFKENDTGLEYIGARNQQIGDGGFIMQLTDLSKGEIVAVSNAEWACTVIHEAPLDKSCENESNPVAGVAPCEFIDLGEPDGWKSIDFDDSGWSATTVHSARAVSPKDGYNQIDWNASAEFIWGPDLETNNTLLCRVTVVKP